MKGILVVALALVFPMYGRVAEPAVGRQAETPARIEREFRQALTIAGRHYAGHVDFAQVTESAVRGMLASLDPHSNYLDAKDYAEMQREQESRFFGIGVTISQRNGRVHILSVIPGGPAARAGLRYGDAIVRVDDASAVGWTTAQVAKHVRGERNTTVSVTVERIGQTKPLTFRIKRGAVPLPSITTAFMIRPGVGYIGLTRGFQGTTINELQDAIRHLKEQGLHAMVIDLRGNPGGLLSQAVRVASQFLKPGEEIVRVVSRRRPRPAYRALSRQSEDFPLVVLINRASASASEIVAGALQDHDRALIVGEPSFGKGLVQTVFPVVGGVGGAVILTTGRYYTPSGRLIQRDYSHISNYDYFAHRSGEQHGSAATTDAGRPVYGGEGIEPDKLIRLPNDPLHNRLFGAAFEFSRHLIAGRIPGLGRYRPDQPLPAARGEDMGVRIDDSVMQAFRQFVAERPEFQLTSSDIESEMTYVRQRIQIEIVSARFGVEKGNRVALKYDQQLLGAIEALPQARELVENLRQPHNKHY